LVVRGNSDRINIGLKTVFMLRNGSTASSSCARTYLLDPVPSIYHVTDELDGDVV
jgi:hypothetical protein